MSKKIFLPLGIKVEGFENFDCFNNIGFNLLERLRGCANKNKGGHLL